MIRVPERGSNPHSVFGIANTSNHVLILVFRLRRFATPFILIANNSYYTPPVPYNGRLYHLSTDTCWNYNFSAVPLLNGLLRSNLISAFPLLRRCRFTELHPYVVTPAGLEPATPTLTYHYSFHYQFYKHYFGNTPAISRCTLDKQFRVLNCLWSGLYLGHIEMLQHTQSVSFPFCPGFYFRRLQTFKDNFNLGPSCISSLHTV